MAKRLDPKHELTYEHVIIVDIASFFGNVKHSKPLIHYFHQMQGKRYRHCIGRSMASVISPTMS